MADLVAAVDCGTNSTRMLISDGHQSIERIMRITRLGDGVASTGRLAPEAIERVVQALLEFRVLLDRYGVQKVRATATSAARDSVNCDEFFDAAQKELSRHCGLDFTHGARIVPAGLGSDGPLVGAAAVGWMSLGELVLSS